MKGRILFSIGTSRGYYKLQTDFPTADIEKIESGVYHLTVPIENIDPENPALAVQTFREESGQDLEVFTLTLENGQVFTEENEED
jgi:hypothetical protein